MRARNYVAGEDVCSVRVGIAEEESEGNDRPRIAVTVVRPLQCSPTGYLLVQVRV